MRWAGDAGRSVPTGRACRFAPAVAFDWQSARRPSAREAVRPARAAYGPATASSRLPQVCSRPVPSAQAQCTGTGTGTGTAMAWRSVRAPLAVCRPAGCHGAAAHRDGAVCRDGGLVPVWGRHPSRPVKWRAAPRGQPFPEVVHELQSDTSRPDDVRCARRSLAGPAFRDGVARLSSYRNPMARDRARVLHCCEPVAGCRASSCSPGLDDGP